MLLQNPSQPFRASSVDKNYPDRWQNQFPPPLRNGCKFQADKSLNVVTSIYQRKPYPESRYPGVFIVISIIVKDYRIQVYLFYSLIAFKYRDHEERWSFKHQFKVAIPPIHLHLIFYLQPCAYQFRYSLFKDSEETIHSAGINATSYEPPWFFSYRKTKKKFF